MAFERWGDHAGRPVEAEMDERLPSFPWRRSAPESLVLNWGPETGDPWTLKVALLELVIRGHLHLSHVERSRLFRSSVLVNVLSPGESFDPSAAGPLHTVMGAFQEVLGIERSVPVTKVATAVFTRRFRRVRTWLLRERWDRTGYGFVHGDILPCLQRQGLFAREDSTRLGLFTTSRWSLTPAGETALAELLRINALGREAFPGWVEHEPELAKCYVELAGPAILLLGGTAPLLSRLCVWMESSGGGEDPEWRRDPFHVAALARTFGPGPRDDLDAAFFAISNDVDRAWKDLREASGGGLFISVGNGE